MKEYLTRNEFQEWANISKTTFFRDKPKLERKYKSFQPTAFKTKGKLLMIHNVVLQEYVYDGWIKEEKLSYKRQEMLNIFKDPGSIPMHLHKYKWSFFCTVAYKDVLNSNQCRSRMTDLFLELIEKHSLSVKLFFVTEPFENRKGQHNHFLVEVTDESKLKAIRMDIKNFFHRDKCDIEKYDDTKLGVFYLAKNGLQGENWDLYVNNSSDNLEYMI